MVLNRRLVVIMLSLLWVVAVVGCAGQTPKKEPVPDWVTQTPKDDNYFYAVGISGRTYRAKDAWDQAANRARAELGRTIVTHVSTRGLSMSTDSGGFNRQLLAILSDAELNFTEIVARWFDRYGSFERPEHYYVLVRIEKKQAQVALKAIEQMNY
jgi:hypothetical protein